MDERVKKAFDFAADLTRQLITLATVIIAAMITFFDKAGSASTLSTWKFKASLGVYLCSIVSGLLALMALTGHLCRGPEALTPYAGNIRLFSLLQIFLFLIATGWIIFLSFPS
jgi:hypothetical protein